MVTFKEHNLQDLRRNEVLQLIAIPVIHTVTSEQRCALTLMKVFLLSVRVRYIHT